MTWTPTEGAPVWWNGRPCMVLGANDPPTSDDGTPLWRIRDHHRQRNRTVRETTLRPRRTADTPARSHLAPEVARQGTAERPPMVEQPKPRGRWRSEAYLRFVREHPCCVCGAEAGTEAHHWQPYASGMGRKPDDSKAVPLCTWDHRHWHDHGRFQGTTRAEAERLMLEAQVRCLSAWLTREKGAA